LGGRGGGRCWWAMLLEGVVEVGIVYDMWWERDCMEMASALGAGHLDHRSLRRGGLSGRNSRASDVIQGDASRWSFCTVVSKT